MCFIGLLLPVRCNSEPERPKSRSSGHRSSGHRSSHHESSSHRRSSHRRSHHESSDRKRSSHRRSHNESSDHRSSSHRRSERERELSEAFRQKEKDALRDLSIRAEDAITRLCVSLERSFFEEQRTWREQERLDREQERLDREERAHLGLERQPSEKAPPYTLRDENRRPPTPEPRPRAGVVVDDSPECRNSHDRNSTGSAYCCHSCVCTRCGSASMKCPEIPELDGTRVRRVIEIESGVPPRRRRV